MAAVLACRNKSSRLYAKPLQNLDIKNSISILDYMVDYLKKFSEINDIILAISEDPENDIYRNLADKYGIPYVTGDDRDVLARLIKAAKVVGADHIFRVTTESPYTYMDNIKQVYAHHCAENIAYSGTKDLPDGANYQILSLEALERSWNEGERKHRSELCDLYIRENQDKFRIAIHDAPKKVSRTDIRLTVDYPEDLIVMRKIYEDLQLSDKRSHSLEEIVDYLDSHPKINAINNWIDSGIGRVWY
jgi:spore coat polysaccharide biosynthesis protein SpsF